jgi:hypothetical protein
LALTETTVEYLVIAGGGGGGGAGGSVEEVLVDIARTLLEDLVATFS